MVVSNLDRLIWLFNSSLKIPRDFLIEKMLTYDPDQTRKSNDDSSILEQNQQSKKDKCKEMWAMRAKASEPFPRSDMASKPTHWWLFIFAIEFCTWSTILRGKQMMGWMKTRVFPIENITTQRNINESIQASAPEQDKTKNIYPDAQRGNTQTFDLTSVVVDKDRGTNK